ncbi:MAG: hypothetical protein NC318_10940 [Blautia sp.]|nr:hypothetical protein [Blautia sp.]
MFDSICNKLFGKEKEEQKKLLIKLVLVSLVLIIVAVVMDFKGAYAFMFIVWGWRALCACVGITKISQFFEYNIVIIIIAVLAWLTIGMVAGIGICIIGVIRLIQLMVGSPQP